MYKNISEELEKHKKYIETEYIEFFKSRQRIKSEWGQYCRKQHESVELYRSEILEWDHKIHSLAANDQRLAQMITMVFDSVV